VLAQLNLNLAMCDEKKFRALKSQASLRTQVARLSKKLLTEGDAFDAGASIRSIYAR
jgi:hypothetical protein